jgi:hypothetical protein
LIVSLSGFWQTANDLSNNFCPSLLIRLIVKVAFGFLYTSSEKFAQIIPGKNLLANKSLVIAVDEVIRAAGTPFG